VAARRRLAALCAVSLFMFAPAGTAQDKKSTAPAKGAPAKEAAKPSGASAQQRTQLQGEQRELQARLARLRKQLAEAEASKTEAADALASSERAISTANRRLRELRDERSNLERELTTLQERSRIAAARQGEQEQQLAAVARLQFALARQQDWQRVLDGGSPADRIRELGYLDYVVAAKSEAIAALRDRQHEMAELEVLLRDKQAQLAANADEEQNGRRELLKQQAERRKTLDALARQISSQRQSIATLERDDKRLSGLIENINRVLAEQAQRQARERERQAAAKRNAPSPARSTPPPAVASADPPLDTEFGQRRGKLRLPVSGEVLARFGSPRHSSEGANAPTWKGVFIRAATGADVHAVAAGRVVFADWLRGFGNLLILDHGDGFLSVYGNNESLLKNLGDQVASGDVIAEVGNTGGNSEPGLYFEIRFQGRPLDPLRWAQAR
jgi:septal ring factor EnvC (AmiA/AmiB activator)